MTTRISRLLGSLTAPSLATAGLLAMTSGAFAQDADKPKAEKAPNPPAQSAKESETPKQSPPAAENRDKAQETKQAAKETARDTEKAARETSRESTKTAEKATSDASKAAGTRDERPSAKSSSRRASEDRETDRPARTDREDSADADRSERSDRETSRSTARAGARASADVQVDKLRPADMGLWLKSSNDALVISDVERSGPIAKVGFREGDRIVSVNGERVRGERDFITYIFAEDVRRERVKVIVLRDDQEEIVYVEPIMFIEEMQVVQSDPLEEYGIVVDDRYDDQIVVWKVIPRSPAYYAGIRAGDVIVIFDGQDVAAPNQLVTLVQKVDADRVSVTVKRDRKDRELDLDLTEVRAGTRGEARAEVRTERASERREAREENREENREERGRGEPRAESAPRAGSETAPRPSTEPSREPRNSVPSGGNNPQRGVLPRPFNR